MCDSEPSFGPALGAYSAQSAEPKPDAKASGIALARLMERQLGYSEGRIDPIALRLFIRAYWSRVAKLAHDIHDSDD